MQMLSDIDAHSKDVAERHYVTRTPAGDAKKSKAIMAAADKVSRPVAFWSA